MSADHVTRPEFEIWRESQKDLINSIGSELKQISSEIKETNGLLREDISITKDLIKEHIAQYNADKANFDRRFKNLAKNQETLTEAIKEGEGATNTFKLLKWGFGIVLTGALTASGIHLYNKWFVQPESIKIEKSKE